MPSLVAPFPYYGGKSRWAATVWEALGSVEVYAEPFAGSLAVLLRRPNPKGREVVCDLDGHVVNFWRALRADPGAVAYYADYPSFHDDLTARHRWLVWWGRERSELLTQDPDFHDAKAAGWWCWGISNWIGGGFCQAPPGRQMPSLASDHGGRGVQPARRSIPSIQGKNHGARGVAVARDCIPDATYPTKAPKMGGVRDGGTGVQAIRVGAFERIGDGSRLAPWFDALAQRLAKVVVVRRSWESILTPSILMQLPAGGQPPVGVFLDPPYRKDGRHRELYAQDADDVAEASWRWAVEHGETYRVAYACTHGDVDLPAGWTEESLSFQGGWSIRGKRDAVLFSPACLGTKRLI